MMKKRFTLIELLTVIVILETAKLYKIKNIESDSIDVTSNLLSL